MNITKTLIDKVLNIITGGLTKGAGDMRNTVCVQQAVSKACGKTEYGDHPTFCVAQETVGFGIGMNDRLWSSQQARADGMRRFAVAELGSNKVDCRGFNDKVTKRWQVAHPDRPNWGAAHGDQDLREIMEHAVQVLIELGTEGSNYLYLTEPGCSQEHK